MEEGKHPAAGDGADAAAAIDASRGGTMNSAMTTAGNANDVIVVGGGVAGLAAAHAMVVRGAKVTLLERKPYFGGRAYSYEHPALETIVDSQHVLLGCCTNLMDLFAKSGTSSSIRWYDELVFLEPGGRASRIAPTSLPAPLHRAIDFLQAPMLNVQDKIGIGAALAALLQAKPMDDNSNMAEWLRRKKQTGRAVRRFWELTASVTLNDSLENCSLKYGAKVFRELLLKSVQGGRLGIPTVPLSDLFGAVAANIRAHGGDVVLRASVDAIEQQGGRWRVASGDREWHADVVVLAGAFEQMQSMLGMLPESDERAALAGDLAKFTHSSIVTTHLWFDREFTGLHHAALLDTTYEWIFNKTRIRNADAAQGSYVELVKGSANAILNLGREELIERALTELKLFFPALASCRLVKSAVLKEARATFSATPGLDAYRPGARTAWPGLFVAGDWTRTDWPSTMESAARSGYLAAEAICGEKVLQPDIAASGLMQLFG
jgi:squalene-associated FAD-dependent desaturase